MWGQNGTPSISARIAVSRDQGIYWGDIGIMENKMEAKRIIGIIYGLYRAYSKPSRDCLRA